MKLPVGIQTFREIREEQYLYIDKTERHSPFGHQWQALFFGPAPAASANPCLSQPLKSWFLGNKALFEGLALSKTDYDITTYPVIKMEFTRMLVREVADLEQYIINATNACAKNARH